MLKPLISEKKQTPPASPEDLGNNDEEGESFAFVSPRPTLRESMIGAHE
jgi:hypothetical protein